MQQARLQIEANQAYLGQHSIAPLDFPDLTPGSHLREEHQFPASLTSTTRPAYDDSPRETKRRKGPVKDDQ